jgi:hypothetical protein
MKAVKKFAEVGSDKLLGFNKMISTKAERSFNPSDTPQNCIPYII